MNYLGTLIIAIHYKRAQEGSRLLQELTTSKLLQVNKDISSQFISLIIC